MPEIREESAEYCLAVCGPGKFSSRVGWGCTRLGAGQSSPRCAVRAREERKERTGRQSAPGSARPCPGWGVGLPSAPSGPRAELWALGFTRNRRAPWVPQTERLRCLSAQRGALSSPSSERRSVTPLGRPKPPPLCCCVAQRPSEDRGNSSFKGSWEGKHKFQWFCFVLLFRNKP